MRRRRSWGSWSAVKTTSAATPTQARTAARWAWSKAVISAPVALLELLAGAAVAGVVAPRLRAGLDEGLAGLGGRLLEVAAVDGLLVLLEPSLDRRHVLHVHAVALHVPGQRAQLLEEERVLPLPEEGPHDPLGFGVLGQLGRQGGQPALRRAVFLLERVELRDPGHG